MDDLQNNSNTRSPELVIPEPLQTPFAKPPSYGENQETLPVKSGRSGKRILKLLLSILIFVAVIIGGYFAVNSYFPEYAKYVNPYLGPVLDPVMEQIQPVLDKMGLAKPASQNVNQPQSPTGTTPTPLPGLGGLGQPRDESFTGWKTYRNFEYGFELRLPRDWDNYFVYPENIPEYKIVYFFCLPTSIEQYKNWKESHCDNKTGFATSFLISVFTLQQWDQDQKAPTGRSILLDKNSQYIFGYGLAHDPPDDIMEKRKNIDQILSTFKFPSDADGDGLPDTEEPKYGTNPNNRDTDGDSWPDGEEVQNGYNPLGPGRAK